MEDVHYCCECLLVHCGQVSLHVHVQTLFQILFTRCLIFLLMPCWIVCRPVLSLELATISCLVAAFFALLPYAAGSFYLFYVWETCNEEGLCSVRWICVSVILSSRLPESTDLCAVKMPGHHHKKNRHKTKHPETHEKTMSPRQEAGTGGLRVETNYSEKSNSQPASHGASGDEGDSLASTNSTPRYPQNGLVSWEASASPRSLSPRVAGVSTLFFCQ